MVRFILPFDEIPAGVPFNNVLKAGDMLGFREFLGTNKTENVYATWDGGDMIEFSNGIVTCPHLLIQTGREFPHRYR